MLKYRLRIYSGRKVTRVYRKAHIAILLVLTLLLQTAGAGAVSCSGGHEVAEATVAAAVEASTPCHESAADSTPAVADQTQGGNCCTDDARGHHCLSGGCALPLFTLPGVVVVLADPPPSPGNLDPQTLPPAPFASFLRPPIA